MNQKETNGPDQPQVMAELDFRSSPQVTLGVELELQILDPDRETGEMAPGALRILDACRQEGIEGIDGEFLLSMIEVKTGICANVAEVRDFLLPALRKLKNITTTVGYELALGGSHPFSRACKNAISPGERYERIRKRQGWLAYQEALFGLHVHVGVPDAKRAIGLMNLLTPYLPHLLALSANSPFWQGVDTDFSSVRSMLFRPSAHSGIPPYFKDWDEFSVYYAAMRQGGVYEATKDLYWDLRPRPDLGTIEFRICDAPGSLLVVLGLTALIRHLVIDGLHKLDDDPRCGEPGPTGTWLAGENKCLAARYGPRAECLMLPGRPRETMAEQIERLIAEVRPISCMENEEGFLNPFMNMGRYECGADRLRHLYRQSGNWKDVMDEMKFGWTRALDLQEIGEMPLTPRRSVNGIPTRELLLS